jgi:hypothetical protein
MQKLILQMSKEELRIDMNNNDLPSYYRKQCKDVYYNKFKIKGL